jgi:hypothetical protein
MSQSVRGEGAPISIGLDSGRAATGRERGEP